ncbi:MAG: VOC family protein [Allorhizobium sp.]
MQGTFIWYELMTTDRKAAADFYAAVVGWEFKEFAHMTANGDPYSVFNVPGYDMGSAGALTITTEMEKNGVTPEWCGYVGVDDVDAKARDFAAHGGAVHIPPTDIPHVGRFAVVADPHGAYLNLFKPVMADAPPGPPPGTPGTLGWSELMADNGDEAFAFYSKMFGWEKDMAVDMGTLGTYQTFTKDGVGPGGIGGMMTRMPDMPRAFWGYYTNVEAIDAAGERVKAAGGEVVDGPMEVPGGSWTLQCRDPQGAHFALVANKR